MKISIEKIIQIWDDDLGCRWEVREDLDGLNQIQIDYVERDGRRVCGPTFPVEVATAIADAIYELKQVIQKEG